MLKRNLSANLFLFFLLLMPINNIYEVYAMKQGILPYGGWSMALTPASIKIYKDIFIFIFSILIILELASAHQYRIYFFSHPVITILFLIVLMLIFVSISIVNSGLLTAMLGLRAYMNVVYVFVGLMLFPTLKREKLHRVLFLLILLQLTLQVYQYVEGQGLPVFAELRSPGFFIVPATAGLFSLLAYYVLPRNKTNFVLCFMSLILSTSTIGLVVFIFTIIYGFCRRYINNLLGVILFATLGICVLFTLYNFAGDITGRGMGAVESLNARIGILSAVYSKSDVGTIIWGNGFGLATSQATLSESGEYFITDNTFLSLFLNMGIISVVLYIVFLINLFVADRSKMIFFTVLLYSITANIFELNPVSALLFVVVGFIFHEYYTYRKNPEFNKNTIAKVQR